MVVPHLCLLISPRWIEATRISLHPHFRCLRRPPRSCSIITHFNPTSFNFASRMSLVNLTQSSPLWYSINDSLIITINIIGMLVAALLIVTAIRLADRPCSISDLIACNTSLAIGLSCSATLFNVCFALASDLRGRGYKDPLCIGRGILRNIAFLYMMMALCLKAFNRLRCIVYQTSLVARSYRSFIILILFQWSVLWLLALPLVLTDAVDYDWGSHLCLVPMTNTGPFSFLSTYQIGVGCSLIVCCEKRTAGREVQT